MQSVGITTDSSSCLPLELVEHFDIQVLPLQFVIGGKTYLDGVYITPSQFYAMLPHLGQLPTTSPSSQGRYRQAIDDKAGRYQSVFCITVSKSFSAMFDSAREAAELAEKTHVCLRTEVLDSDTAAGVHGLVVLEAARSTMSQVHLVAVIGTQNRLAVHRQGALNVA